MSKIHILESDNNYGYWIAIHFATPAGNNSVGDANSDGAVDIVDATYIARHVIGIAGYESIDEEAANVNGDSVLDMADSMYMTKHVTGIAGFEDLR